MKAMTILVSCALAMLSGACFVTGLAFLSDGAAV